MCPPLRKWTRRNNFFTKGLIIVKSTEGLTVEFSFLTVKREGEYCSMATDPVHPLWPFALIQDSCVYRAVNVYYITHNNELSMHFQYITPMTAVFTGNKRYINFNTPLRLRVLFEIVFCQFAKGAKIIPKLRDKVKEAIRWAQMIRRHLARQLTKIWFN